MVASDKEIHEGADVEELLTASDMANGHTARTPRGILALSSPKRSVGWVASVALGIAAAILLTATFSKVTTAGDVLHGPPPAQLEEDQSLFEGLEEWPPALVRRLANPDPEEDLAELRRIGMDHPDILKVLSRDAQVATSLTDLRQILAYRRRMMDNASLSPANVSLQAVGGELIDNASVVDVDPGTNPWTRPVQGAKCSFHVGQTLLYLVEACMAIRDASLDCPQIHKSGKTIQGGRKGRKAKDVCAIDIMSMFASFGWTSYFIAALSTQCVVVGEPLSDAQCVADVTSLVASLLNLGAAAAGLGLDCNGRNVKQAVINHRHTRKENKFYAKFNTTYNDHSAIGHCVISPIQAMYWLFRAALFIKNAADDCPHAQSEKDGWQGCSIDALYTISSFGYAASFLASAASDCAPVMNTNAQCAGDITGLVASVAIVSANSIGFSEGACWPKKVKKKLSHVGI